LARLIYSIIESLDGYVADESGSFDWAAPDEEVHAFVNDLERSVGTYLYGRRMYETMVFWETAHEPAGQPDFIRDFARIWQATDKIVYSKTLDAPRSARTRIERSFDPDAVRKMKAAATRDITVADTPPPSVPGRSSTSFSSPLSSSSAWRRSLPAERRVNRDSR
jgi:dihydrofolate reductase